jgi:membrane-associated phospholipid phosphatase
LNKLYKLNRPFISTYSVFLLLSTLGLFWMEKGDLVLFFSEHRTPVGDTLLKGLTVLGDGAFFGIAALIFLFFKYRYAITTAALGLSVMLVSFVAKSVFALDRPLPYFQKTGMADQLTFVAGVDVHTGATSFPSGHTMTAFALYGLLAFLLTEKKWIGFFLSLLAIGAAISRVYLVQHFLQDIYLGSLMGFSLAVLWYSIQKAWSKEWLDHNLWLFLKRKRV